MPNLNDLMQFLCRCAEQTGHSFSEDVTVEIERQIRMEFGGERIYVQAVDSRKDAGRTTRIVELSKRLPTGVVADRLGISRQLVHYHLRKAKTRP